jgi:hypothetical protein
VAAQVEETLAEAHLLDAEDVPEDLSHRPLQIAPRLRDLGG